jgi:hypothetical protein
MQKVSWIKFIANIVRLCDYCKHKMPTPCNRDCIEDCFASFAYYEKKNKKEQNKKEVREC